MQTPHAQPPRRHPTRARATGGPIALVKEGDVIAIDVETETLELRVSDDELAGRRAAKQP